MKDAWGGEIATDHIAFWRHIEDFMCDWGIDSAILDFEDVEKSKITNALHTKYLRERIAEDGLEFDESWPYFPALFDF
jgi:hypothetical protein